MRLLFIALACLINMSVFGQTLISDTLVKFNNFTVNYSQNLLQPLEVWYEVKCPNKQKINCSANWRLHDGILTSSNKLHYKYNNWDRGHMAPAASFDCSCEEKQETYSYVNCALQNDSLNQRIWKQLEKRERE